MDTPIVSIITPTFNCARYLPWTINSVINQDYPRIEYIVIDDGSTDNTQAILEQYRNRNINILSRSNKGEQKTVNQGLDMAHGKYAIVLNSDDVLFTITAVSRMVAHLETHPEYSAVYPDWYAIDEENNILHRVKSREFNYNHMVTHHFCIPSVGTMFKTEFNVRRNDAFRWIGDYVFWLDLGKHGDMSRIPHILAAWRQRSGQATSEKNDLQAEEHIKLLNMCIEADGLSNSQKLLSTAWTYIVVSQISPRMAYYATQAIMTYPPVMFQIDLWYALLKKLYTKVNIDPRR